MREKFACNVHARKLGGGGGYLCLNFSRGLLLIFHIFVFFFSEQPFFANYLTLDSHTITVISQAFAYSSGCRRKP